MNARSIMRCLAIVAVLLLGMCRLTAQPDIRITPPDTAVAWYDAGSLIQSAARSGDTTLVVWGTTENLSDTTRHNILRMQMLVDTAPVGDQRTVTDSGADAFGACYVAATRAGFLVFWNDSRGGDTTIYARTVRPEGTLGQARIWSRGRMADAALCRLVALSDGSELFIWTDRRGGTPAVYARRLGGNGEPMGEERLLGAGTFRDVLPAAPGVGEYVIYTGGIALLVGEGGAIDSIRVPGFGLDAPHRIEPDGSLAIIADTMFMRYGSLSDSVPYATSRLPAVASAAFKYAMIRRDGEGYFIYYPEGLRGGRDQYWFIVHRARLVDGAWSDTAFDSTVITPPHSAGGSDAHYDETPAPMVMGDCDGTEQLTWSVLMTEGYVHGQTFFHEDVFYYNVDRDGIYQRTMQPVTLGRCQAFSPVPVLRIADTTASVVQCAIPIGDTVGNVLLRASLARHVVHQRYIHPGLYLHADTLAIAWELAKPERAFLMGKLDLGSTVPVSPVVFVPPTDPYFLSPYALDRVRSIGLYVQGEAAMLGEFEGYHDSHGSGTTYLNLYSLWPSGPVKSVGSFITPETWSFRNGRYSFDPDSRTVLAGAMVRWKSARLFLVDAAGAQRTGFEISIDSLESIVNVGGSRWIRVSTKEQSLFLYDSSRVRQSRSLPNLVPSTWQRITGGRVLRFYPALGSDSLGRPIDSAVTFELFMVDTTIRGPILTSTLKLPSGLTDLAVVERPADRSLHLLVGAADGLHHLTLDSALAVWSADSVVNENPGRVGAPTGIFKGDTLYTAWEDYRNGASDIYARAIVGLPRLPAQPAPVDTTHQADSTDHQIADSLATHDSQGNPLPVIPPELLHLSVHPVPASDHLVVSFRLPIPGEVSLELYDLLGRLVMREDLGELAVGAVTERWDLRGVGSGVYFLRLHGPGGATDVRKVMLLGAP